MRAVAADAYTAREVMASPRAFAADPHEPDAARTTAFFVVVTPLLWGAGLLVPVAGLLVLWLTLRGGTRLLVAPIAVVWVLVAVAQGISVVVNGVGDERGAGFIAYRLLSTGVTGWLLLGLALAVGARYRMASPVLVRAITILGGYFLLFGLLALLLHSFTGLTELELPTPPALVLPASAPAVEFSFTMRVFSTEDLLGRDLPRLVLFYPWAVVLGFAGIAVFFVAQLEHWFPLRLLGSAGGLLAVLGSQGRAPILGLIILLFANAILTRFDRRALVLAAASTFFAMAVLVAFGITPIDVVTWAYEEVSALRPGSTMARELGYALSIAGFLDSPVLGQGWVGGWVATGIPLPVGSHSSFYGLLYTGGLVTFGAFAIALVTTLVVLVRRAGGGAVQRTGLLIALALALLSYGEGIYSFVLPCTPLLLFLGGTLAAEPAPVPEWRRA
jgi:hypothetical protein